MWACGEYVDDDMGVHSMNSSFTTAYGFGCMADDSILDCGTASSVARPDGTVVHSNTYGEKNNITVVLDVATKDIGTETGGDKMGGGSMRTHPALLTMDTLHIPSRTAVH